MLTLLVPASTPNGVDIYSDENGSLIESPAGQPPPGATPSPAATPAPAPTMSAMDAEGWGMGAKAGDPMPTPSKPAAAAPAAPAAAPANPRRARFYDADSPEAQAIGAAAAANPPSKIKPGYRTIIDLESSAGENVGHDEITTKTYKGMTAAGESGLVPPNVYMLVRDEPDLRKKYYDAVTKLLGGKEYAKGTERTMSVAEANKLTAIVNGSPALDKELSERFWQNELEATAKRGADGKKTYDEDRARMYHYAGSKGTAYYDAVMAGKDEFKFKGDTYAVSSQEDLEDELTKWRGRRAQYQDSEYDHPLLASQQPATGLPSGMASDASPSASAQPATAQPAPFDDFEPAWPGEQPPEEPLGPVAARPQSPGSYAPASPAPLPTPAPPGTPGVGVGAVQTIDMGNGATAQATREGEPVAQQAAPGEPMTAIAPELREGARYVPPTATAIPAGKVSMAGTTAPKAGAAPAAAAPAMSEVDLLRQQIKQARDAYAKGPNIPAIDPERLWKSKSTGGRIMSAIALALGTFGAGMTGGQNAALQIIQQAIADDIESQKLTAAQQQAAWAASYNVIDSMIDELAIISKDEGGPKAPTFAAMNKLMGAREAVKQFADLRGKYASLPWHSAASSRAPWATEASKYEADLAPALAQIIFELSGKQSNEREAARLTAMLPSAKTLFETKGAGLQKFDAIQKWIDHKYQAVLDAAETAYPGRDFDSLSEQERRTLTGESEDSNADSVTMGELFNDFEAAE